MSDTNKDDSTQATRSMWVSYPLFSADFLRSVPGAPTQFYFGLYRGTLDLAARRLQAQAEYVKKLSAIDQPGDALAAHNAFARETIESWFEEGRRLFNESRAFVTPSK